MTKYLLLFILFAFIQSLYGQRGQVPPDLSDSQLRSASETVTITGKELFLVAKIWVDYMPTIPPSGPSSHTVIILKTKDNSPIPTILTADAIWIISKDKTWKSWLPKESPYPAYDKPEEIKRMVSGHTWPPGTNVEVIVRIKDHKGKEYFLKTLNQLVEKTY